MPPLSQKENTLTAYPGNACVGGYFEVRGAGFSLSAQHDLKAGLQTR
jgi:hypothetical protein